MKNKFSKQLKLDNRSRKIPKFDQTDDALAVLRDSSSGKEYYLSVIDTFHLGGRDYVVMYNYEPDDGSHKDPELVAMRTSYGKSGEQYFFSIKDKQELDLVFANFISRLSDD